MTVIKAIIVLPEEKKAAVQEVEKPTLRDEWTLVQTKAVALNPTDWKHIDFGYANSGARIGCDFAGVVIEVGRRVSDFKPGDRVAGFCHGGHRTDHETGAFGAFVLAKACGLIKIPHNIDFETAAILPVAWNTCGLGLYKSLQLPLPSEPARVPFPLLIHGGSTATGMWAIQFAKLSGLAVIATASPRNFEYLKSLGADEVFDYRSLTCSADIRAHTGNKLTHAWDCVGGGELLCAEALSSTEPSKYGAINASNSTDGDIIKKANPLVDGSFFILAYNILNEPYEWQDSLIQPPVAEMEYAKMFREIARDLLEKGKLTPIKMDVNKGGSGLEGVMKGLDYMRKAQVSGKKLVYTL